MLTKTDFEAGYETWNLASFGTVDMLSGIFTWNGVWKLSQESAATFDISLVLLPGATDLSAIGEWVLVDALIDKDTN